MSVPSSPPVSLLRLFRGFVWASLNAFGGGLNAHLLRLIRREGWLDEADFADYSTFAQTLPGSNNGNLTVLIGHRLAGPVGAAVALAGLLLPGSLLMVGVTWLYFGGHLDLNAGPGGSVFGGALRGAAAAAFGISLSAGLNILRRTLARPLALVTALATALLTLTLPEGTLLALAVLVPLGVLLGREKAEGKA